MIERRYLIAAILLHVVIFLLLFASALFARKVQAPPMIEATIVSLERKQSQAEKIAPPQPPPAEEVKPEPKPEPKPKPPTPQELQEKQLKQQQQREEQQRKAQEQAERKRVEEEQRKQKQLELKAEAERKRQEALQKKAEEDRRKQEEQRLKQEEAERIKQEQLRQKQEAEERQRQIEAERKRQEQAERDRRAAEEKRRKDEMAAALAAELQGRIQAAQADWGSVLAARIRKFWNRPPASPTSFHCVVAMQLAPSGEVLSAKVTQSCGNDPLDRSVEAAVIKASPMPLPPDPAAFVPNISITFCPAPNACQ